MSDPDRDREKPARRSRGIDVISTLLVVTFLLIIVGMLMPVKHLGYGNERKTSCGNNQRQIILSMMVYANDNDQFFPVRPTDAQGHFTTNPDAIDGFCTAAASLEMLMIRNTDLPLKLFVCPSNTGTLEYLPNPTFTGMGSATMAYDSGVSQWGNNHLPETPGGPGAMAFAYDWSAPTNASAIRVMITDRGNLTVAHKKVIMGAAADGHVLTINITDELAQRAPGTHVTMGLSGANEIASFAAKDSSDSNGPDDVYDDHGDDHDMNTPAQGSATRSWVR